VNATVNNYKFPLDDDSVAVVIGSGAGGGTMANQLAGQGINVVCLETGKRLQMSDIVNDEAAMFPKFTWLDEVIGEGDALPDFPLWICKTVGGTTMHWTAATPRLQAHEMRARSTYGEIEGATLVDWPLSLAELEPYYARAEQMMGVTGTNGIPMLPGNNNYKVLEAGGRNIGYTDIDTNAMAINPAPRDGRGGCMQLGFCTSGCATQAKWCTLYTEIRDAEKTDHFELRAESMAVKILHQGDRVTGVQYLDADGRMHEQKARFICVAGNAPGTTRLLLNSKSNQFPDGLANTSGQVGRNYMRHMLAAVVGVMPGEVHIYKGAQVAGVIRDETRHDPSRGFSGGFQLHTVGLTPASLASLMLQGKWGKEFTGIMQQYKNFATVMIMGEDLPTADNRISLHPERKDQYGMPVPVVHYTNHPNNRAMLRYGLEVSNKLYHSLGAGQIFDLKDVFPATHNMGTARMGEDPATSVTNSWGQTHDIENLFISDGSLFPTAGCENPTITIVSLVLRQAEYIVDQINRGVI
jgi:choline dehydrogenase-like flavoprotein